MNPGLIVKLRPTGPWRIGADHGARDRVDRIYHSDSVYSAVCGALRLLGSLPEWIEATTAAPPAVSFSSCFPFTGETALVVPPRTLWPPPAAAKVRWKGARFVPLSLVNTMLGGQMPEEDHWQVDGESECLVPPGRSGPFRASVRRGGAVDRLSGSIEPHSIACLEFAPGAGLWTVASFANEQAYEHWNPLLRAAFRLLADSGFGGGRSRGWGRSETPEFIEGALPEMIVNSVPQMSTGDPMFWLLSLFTPSSNDAIDWQRGSYATVTRGGRVDSPGAPGATKKSVNMLEEGSVIAATAVPVGTASDVAPDGFPHPVYRAGHAVAIPIAAGVQQ